MDEETEAQRVMLCNSSKVTKLHGRMEAMTSQYQFKVSILFIINFQLLLQAPFHSTEMDLVPSEGASPQPAASTALKRRLTARLTHGLTGGSLAISSIWWAESQLENDFWLTTPKLPEVVLQSLSSRVAKKRP